MTYISLVLIIVSAVCSLVYLLRALRRKPREGEAPIVPGHAIWGNGKEFNENAVEFLHKAQKEHGGIFTIRLLHYHMTIIADPHSFENFSRERNFDFDAIQEHVNNGIFGFSIPDSRKMIKFVGKTTKGSAVPRSLMSFHDNLDSAFNRLVDGGPTASGAWVQDGLDSLLCKTMFQAIFNSIFGHDKETPAFNYSVFRENLHTFHKYFNYLWIGMPSFLFPEVGKALKKLTMQPTCADLMASPLTSEYLKAAIEYMLSNSKTEQDVKLHNLVYLHINMNTFKIAFWCMYHLLNNATALKAVQGELDNVLASKREMGEGEAAFCASDVESMKILDSVVSEAFRLTSGVFMMRHNQADTQFTLSSTGETFTVRGGDKVCMYPPAIHKDPEIFESPLAFKYDRFIDQQFYKNGIELKNPILPFGSVCPGRKIALLQMKWFIITMLTKFDMELLSGEATELDVQYHGHEIIPPTNDVQIRYRVKKEAPVLSVISN